MGILSLPAGLNDLAYLVDHVGFTRAAICLIQHVLHEVNGEQEFILLDQPLVLCPSPTLQDDGVSAQQLTGFSKDLAGCRLRVSLGQGRSLGHEDITRPFQQLCGFMISFAFQASLFVLPDLADDLLIEVLHDVEMVEHNREMGAFLHECFLKIRIHVACNGDHALHPLKANVPDEGVHDILLLAVLKPENTTGFKIHDVSGKLVPSMGLDFVDGQVSCLPVWFPEYTLAIGREFGVKPLQAGLVDALDCALVKPTQHLRQTLPTVR